MRRINWLVVSVFLATLTITLLVLNWHRSQKLKEPSFGFLYEANFEEVMPCLGRRDGRHFISVHLEGPNAPPLQQRYRVRVLLKGEILFEGELKQMEHEISTDGETVKVLSFSFGHGYLDEEEVYQLELLGGQASNGILDTWKLQHCPP